jgi:MerR family transcriptional regulator, light-induced transcriptional regulator
VPAQGARDARQPGVATPPTPAGPGAAPPLAPTTGEGPLEAAGDHEELGPALSVAGAARGLGVAPATLRSWERRYGLAPSLHTKGGHRRYGPSDLARLQVMHRLVREGVPPAEAARVAIRTRIEPEQAAAAGPYAALLTGAEAAGAGADPAELAAAIDEEVRASAGGGHVLPMPRRTRTARGLARAALALDSHSCHRTVESSLAARGAVATWEELVRPVLVAIGERWAQTGRGVEVEHSFSVVVAGAMAAHAARLARPRNDRPVLLASVPDELHDLPLVALQASLADAHVRSHVIGARTPDDALAAAVQRLGPPVVFLWSQMRPATAPQLPPMRPMPVVVVGGPGWVEDLPAEVVRVEDMAAAVAAVRAAMGR